MPLSPLAVRGGFDALTDAIPTLCLCLELIDVRCHDLLADVILGSGVIHVEASAVDWFELCFVHGPIIGTGWGRLGEMVDGSATVQHVSDLVHGVHVATHQGEGALPADLPDGTILAVVCFPLFGDRLSTLQGWRVVCPILVKGLPCGGLNGVHVQRCLIDLIIEARPLPMAM